MQEFKNYIAGEWRESESKEYAPNINPANINETLANFASSTPKDAAVAIEAARESFKEWSRLPGPDRGKILYRFAELLEKHEEELATILTREEGKILKESKGEVTRAVAETRFMAGEASRLTGEHYASEKPGVEIMRRLIPLGPVAVITPWNFPIVTPVRKISPALAYGDTVVFKPATLTPWSAIRLVELYEEAGVPPGVLNVITGSGSKIGDTLSSSSEIRGITFTGSTDIGKRIYSKSIEHFTRVQLEMGGKNPALVYDAEDLDEAAQQIVSAAFSSAGQRCTAISRVIVSEKEHDILVSKMEKLIKKLSVGDPLDPNTDIGPLVSKSQVETASKYVEIARKEHCDIVVGGESAEVPAEGYYFQPTLVTGVGRSSPLALEEIFGPVLSVLVTKSFEDGIEVCNDPQYGLAGCVFTKELSRAKIFIQEMDSGMVHINHGTASQAHVPFGGVKDSGFGAYSIGPTARSFYMNEKVVYLK